MEKSRGSNSGTSQNQNSSQSGQFEITEREYDHQEMSEPDYELATNDQLIEWCYYLKDKFELYINQTNDREALVRRLIELSLWSCITASHDHL